MASFSVVNDVNSTLKYFIEQNIPELSTPGIVTFESPVTISEPVSNPTLSVYLYRSFQNVYHKNNLPEVESTSPPLTIDLFYMFTPYAQTLTEVNTLLEKIMFYFHNNPVLAESYLQGDLIATGNDKLRVYSDDFSLDELNKLWAMFPNTTSRMALFYKVSPVLIPASYEL